MPLLQGRKRRLSMLFLILPSSSLLASLMNINVGDQKKHSKPLFQLGALWRGHAGAVLNEDLPNDDFEDGCDSAG